MAYIIVTETYHVCTRDALVRKTRPKGQIVPTWAYDKRQSLELGYNLVMISGNAAPRIIAIGAVTRRIKIKSHGQAVVRKKAIPNLIKVIMDIMTS